MPRNLASPKDLVEFRARSEEFIAVATAGGLARARRLTDEDLIGPDGRGGLIEQVMTLGTGMLSDVALTPESVRVNDETTVSFILSESDCLPSKISSVRRVDSMSSATSEVDLCLASQMGLMLSRYPHICNVYVVKDSAGSPLRPFQKDEIHAAVLH